MGTLIPASTVDQLYGLILPDNMFTLPFVTKLSNGQNVSWFIPDEQNTNSGQYMMKSVSTLFPNFIAGLQQNTQNPQRPWLNELFALGIMLSSRISEGPHKDRLTGGNFFI